MPRSHQLSLQPRVPVLTLGDTLLGHSQQEGGCGWVQVGTRRDAHTGHAQDCTHMGTHMQGHTDTGTRTLVHTSVYP